MIKEIAIDEEMARKYGYKPYNEYYSGISEDGHVDEDKRVINVAAKNVQLYNKKR